MCRSAVALWSNISSFIRNSVPVDYIFIPLHTFHPLTIKYNKTNINIAQLNVFIRLFFFLLNTYLGGSSLFQKLFLNTDN